MLSAESDVLLANSEALLADSEALLAESEVLLVDNEALLADSEALLADSEVLLADSEALLADSEALLADSEGLLAESKVRLAESEALSATPAQPKQLPNTSNRQRLSQTRPAECGKVLTTKPQRAPRFANFLPAERGKIPLSSCLRAFVVKPRPFFAPSLLRGKKSPPFSRKESPF